MSDQVARVPMQQELRQHMRRREKSKKREAENKGGKVTQLKQEVGATD